MIKYDSVEFKVMWGRGLLMREMAKRLNCTENTVYNIAKREGVFPYKKRND